MPEVPFEQDPAFLQLFNQVNESSENNNPEDLTFDPNNPLETGEPRNVPVDLSLGTPNQWRQPVTPSSLTSGAPNPISAPKDEPYESSSDMMNDVMTELGRKNPTFTEAEWVNPTLTSQKVTRKYRDMSLGYTPGVDLDNYYGEQESIWKTAGKGLIKLPTLTAIKVGQGLGYVAGLLDPNNWGSDIISKAADNGFAKIFDGLDDKLKNEWLPTYQEAEDRNKGFWARAFTDLDFWTDDAVDGLAFMASAWIPGIALSKLGLGLKATQTLSKLRLGVTAAEATVEGAGQAANYLSKANSVFKTGVDKFNAWALATASESMFESVGVKNSVMQALNEDPITGRAVINPETGMRYTEQEKKQVAAAAAQNTFILNAALLSATNAVELSWLGRAFGSVDPIAARGLTGAAKLGDDLALPTSPTKFFEKFISGKTGAFVKGGAQGIVVEGFGEENGQLAIQRINERYGSKGKIADAFNLRELLNQYVEQTGQAIIGNDQEAAVSIGIGGLLGVVGGGFKGASDYVRQRAFNQAAVSAFNTVNQSWLKFGNIYKTEEVVTKNANGNEVRTERVVRDKDNNPVLDSEKIAGITASYQSVNGALQEATQTQDKFKRDVLRDKAFADLVTAHVNAGIEDTMIDKLDAVKKATPEDLAKLGFTLDGTVDEQLSRYKSLASSIIEQNKLLNSDIIFDTSQEDRARKVRLTDLAGEQAVHKNLLSEINNDAQRIKNTLLTSANTSLSDGLVDQLNDINQRIASQKQVIKELKKMGFTEEYFDLANVIINELEEEKAILLEQNKETIKTIKKGKDGKYLYEKKQRNEPGVQEQYDKKIKLKGEVQNHIRELGLKWAKYADTIDGKKNFLKDLILDAVSAAEEQEKETKKSEAEVITPSKTFTINFVNEQGEDDSITIKEGQTYQIKREDGKTDTLRVIKVSEDGKVVTFAINNEGAVEADSQEFAKVAKASGMEEITIPTEKTNIGAQKAEHPKELESDTSIEERADLPTYAYSDKKPKFEEVGFNKTFGRHYMDEEDLFLNKENGSDRFFAFTAKYDLSNGEYSLQVVTKSNDDFGIRQKEDYADDIKVIVVKKTVDKKGKITYNYVNENNEIIPDNEATKDNIVYRSLANIKNWTPTSVRAAYTVDETTPDEIIQNQIDAHIKHQDELVKRTKKAPVFLDVVSNSPGIQRVEYTTAIGEDGKRELAKAPVEGRVIEADPDWSELKSAANPNNYIALRISTRDSALAPGLLAGRAVLQEYNFGKDGKKRYTSKVTRVFNRELLPSEKENIIQALARFSELFGRPKNNPLTLPETNEYTIILEYLRGMLNWSTPKEGQSTNKFFWISNGLHVGDKVYKFDRETIEKNKDAILKDAYHHVNNRMLWREESFQTIKFSDGKAVADKAYDTYQEYLLANRENGDIPPVYTSLPLYDSETPQRTNVYLTWKDPANEEAAPIGPIKRTYPKESVKEGKKRRKKFTAVDKVIDEFINYKTKDITIYGVSIRHTKKKNKFYINFYDPKTNKRFYSGPFSSVKNILDNKYKIRSLIYKLSGYNPFAEVEETKEVKKAGKTISTKPSGKVKGEIILSLDEKGILAGDVVSTVRSKSYHSKFYKGDGIYKSDSGNLFEIEYKGLIKFKNGRIWGKNINMSKAEIAKELGFESWDAFAETPKWAMKDLVESKAVHYYSVSPILEGQEAIEQTEKTPAKKGWIKLSDLGATSLEEAVKILKTGKPATAEEKASEETGGLNLAGIIEKAKKSGKKGWVSLKDLQEAQEEEKEAKPPVPVSTAPISNVEAKKEAIAKGINNSGEDKIDFTEEQLTKAVEGIKPDGEISTASLQRVFKIGYFKATRIAEKIDAELAALEGGTKQTAPTSLSDLMAAAKKSGATGWTSAKQLTEPTAPSVSKQVKVDEPTTIDDAIANAKQENGKLVARLYEENAQTGERRLSIVSSVPIPNGDIVAATSMLKNDLSSKVQTEEEPPFRMPLEEITQLEDFKKLSEVMNRILPQFSINKMSHLIHGKAWGAFYKGAIYIYQKAGIGTGFHEAFEGVWAAYLNDQERETLANDFRSRTGTFYNPFTKETKKYSDASMFDVREMLAEEFSKFIQDSPVNEKFGKGIINFFKQLWKDIKALFNLSKKDQQELNVSINSVFNKIKEGGYRNATPIRELNKLAPAYKSVGTLTQRETAGVLEGLNYYFFTNLYSRGNNINTILGTLTKEQSNALLREVYADSYAQVQANLSKQPNLQSQLEVYKDELYTKFKQNLERYGVMFSELEQDEEDVADTLGIRDSITIDPRKMTNQNIRILLSSIPEVTYKNGSPVLVKNSFNQPKLINGDRIHLILLNELSNIAPVIDANGNRVDVLDQMFDRLDEKYKNEDGSYKKEYYWIKGLKSRLKYWTYSSASDFTGTKIDPSTLSKEEMQLRISFIKSFNNIKTNPDKTIVGTDGEIYNFNPLTNLNIDRVREEWSNNLKLLVQNKQSSIVKLDASGKMIIDRSSQDYALLINFLNFKSQIDLPASLTILENLGIVFSADIDSIAEYETTIRENAIQILSLIKNGELNTVSEIFGNQVIGGRINDLLSIEANFSSEDNVLSYLNANGEPQYAVGIPSLFSNTINILNSVKNHTELINTCPWLGYFDEKGEPVLNLYQQNSELLKKDGILFNKKGERRRGKTLTYHVISGMGLTDDYGTTTANLQFPERVANKIHFLLNNTVFSNINSDKSTEFGINIPGKMLVSAQDVRNFLSIMGEDVKDIAAGQLQSAVDENIINRYVNHLTDEMAAALLQKDNPIYIQYYAKGVNQLGHFRDVLGKQLINKFQTEVLGDKPKYTGPTAHLDFIEAERDTIETKIKTYLYGKILETTEFLKDLDIFEKSPKKQDDRYISDAIDNQTLADILKIKANTEENPSSDNQVIKYYQEDAKESTVRVAFTESNINVLAGILAINEELLLTEQHKLIYGHPAMYKDLAKRANGATSTKESFVEDSSVISWMDSNLPRNDNKQRGVTAHQTTKIVSFKDQDVVSLFYKDIAEGIYNDLIQSGVTKENAEKKVGGIFDSNNELVGYIYDSEGKHTGAIKAYVSLNEADAMAWGMPDAIRDMLFQTSKLTPQQEAQWNYEIAYEKIARSKKAESDPAYKKYNKEELKAAQVIVAKGDPGYIFQVLKPQYFGFATTAEVTHPTFLKHAVQPKFFRHVEGTQYEQLYLAAQNNQVDIIGFESGHKVGNVTNENGEFISIYNDKGKVNIVKTKKGYDFPKDLPQLEVYSKFYGIQVETSNKSKNSVVRGTQVTKLIMVNFFNNGEPINEELGQLIKEYNDTLKAMIKLGKAELLDQLGLVKVNEKEYRAQNLDKLVSILRKEARDRELPDNMIDAINAFIHEDGTQSLEYKFDTLINREKIDNILNSIVDSRVISSKMNGRSSVQVASTLYESNPRNFMYLKDGVYKTLTAKEIKSLTDEEKASIKMTSSNLKFYYNKAGGVSKMECYVSWPFKEATPEEIGLKLENGIYKIPEGGLKNFDKELLNIIGFRIPTQASNSIENIIIKGFTPASNGDMIVVPSEIVGKAGSDFDIDKLNLYFSNHHVEGPEYGSKKFKDFIVNDLIVNGGLTEVAANALINGPFAFKTEDLLKINKATYTEKDKYEKGAKISLEGFIPDIDDLRQAAVVKRSLTNYNAQFKGPKAIKYIKPGTETKAELQNKYISLMSQLISRPENYAQLVSPNTVATLKGLATEISKAKIEAGTKDVEDETSLTYLRTFIGSSRVRERYLTAKRMVGIAALHATFHSIAQVSGLKLNPVYNADSIYYLLGSKDEKLRAINIKLDHHPTTEKGLYNIGHRTDMVDQMISDLFSEAVSGFVDGAKDPFVFDLNFSMNSAGTWFYLTHLGVPTEQIAYLFNQPIMDEYFTELSKNRSNFKKTNGNNLNREELFYKVIAPYYNRIYKTDLLKELEEADQISFWFKRKEKAEVIKNVSAISEDFETFKLSDLKTGINKGFSANPRLQIAVLMSYLEHETQARQMSNFMQAISYDNKKTRTTQENMLQVAKWERSLSEKFINNPEAVLENTFIGEMKAQKEDVFNMFREFFITLMPELQEVFKPLYDKLNNPDYFSTKDDMVNLLNRYQNFVIAYLLHTTSYKNQDGRDETLNELYKELFTGENTLPRLLSDYKTSPNINISDNLIVKELLPLMTDDATKTDNISLFRNKMDTFEINNVIEALDNLKEYAIQTADDKLLNFVNNLAKFSILQSGVQSSNIDFRKILSADVYSELVKTILDSFASNPQIDTADVWRNFHQNNWANRSIVPKAPSWTKFKNGEILISPDSSYATSDYLVKYVKKANISKSEMAKLKKEKRMFDAFEPMLFENTGMLNKKGKMIFKPITKRGNGTRMLEIYKDDRDSIFEKNQLSQKNPKGAVPVNTWISVADLMKAIQEKDDISTPTSEVDDVLKQKEEESKECNS